MNVVNLILSVLVFVLGLAMTIAPVKLLGFLVILLGAGAVVLGLYDLINVRKLVDDQKSQIMIIVRGVVSIIIGVLAILLPVKFATTAIQVMQIILGIYLLIVAVADFYIVYELHKEDAPAKAAAGKGIICLVLGILMFLLKSESVATVLLRIIGVLLMIGGIAYFIYTLKSKAIVVDPENVRDDDGEKSESESAE